MKERVLLLAMLTSLTALFGCASAGPRAGSPGAETEPRRALYPEIATPRQTGFLRVSSEHELYYEESGNPDGKPVVFLHGGPGSGTSPLQRRFFDPSAYRIILFDQAGAGQSRASEENLLRGNTTQELVRHLETLRQHLQIEKWQLFGGSWGTTLALAYAVEHPKRVSEIITWGAFLSRPSELDWLFRTGGASRIFPDAFERFASFIPVPERKDLITAYSRRFQEPDPLLRREAVRRWTAYEDELSRLLPVAPTPLSDAELDDRYLRRAKIESHYFKHQGFLPPKRNTLLMGARKLRGIPIVIVAGRYDMVCPHETAATLKQHIPWAELRIVPDAGHLSGSHAGIVHELISATDRFRL